MASKFKLFALGAAIATFVLVGPTSANLGQLLGDWKNVDPDTRGIVRIMITDAGGAIQVRVCGACHPSPCDWGTVKAVPYAPNVDAPLPADTEYLLADYPESFAQRMVLIGPAPGLGGELRAITLNRFTDNSSRSDFGIANLLKK